MTKLSKFNATLLGLVLVLPTVATAQLFRSAEAAVGDVVATIDLEPLLPAADVFCSIGVAFDGTHLYVDACDDPNIYEIDTSGTLVDTFDVIANGGTSLPNALAFDAKRNGIWIGGQSCITDDQGNTVMPIQFWDFDDDSVTTMFSIPTTLLNPATGNPFLLLCFIDGLAYNENDPTSDADDEIWFSDDVSQEVGLFRPDGTLVKGFDARTVDPSFETFNDGNSGLAIGGTNLYMGNNGGGDVFRADKNTDPLVKVDQFVSGDERQEDMECDPATFSPTEVIWVRTTPQGGLFSNVLTAYEIEPLTCGLPFKAEKFYTQTDVNVEGGEFGTPLPVDEETGKFSLQAVVKPKDGTVSSYNPGQYYAVTKVTLLHDLDKLWISELFGDCTDRVDAAGDPLPSISKVNPDTVPGGALVAVMDPDGAVTDLSSLLSHSDSDGDGEPDLRFTDSNNNGIIDNAEAHLDDVEAGSMVFLYVKFGPGLKGQVLPDDPDALMCHNEEIVEAVVGDDAFSAIADADLMVVPKTV